MINHSKNPEIPVLDHGYIQLIESWGSDETIIETARMSTNKGFKHWGTWLVCIKCGQRDGTIGANQSLCPHHFIEESGDEKLLRYLYENKHSSPFEFGGMTIELQAPIVVFREWHRHRTQSYSELSARYTPLPDCNYIPTPERCLLVSGSNKQAGKLKGSEELTHEAVLVWLEELLSVYNHAEHVYQSGLKKGIPKEVARLPVPVGRYTRMRATANLRNWMAFLTLRSAVTAQWEIRQYAEQVSLFVKKEFPRTYEIFVEEIHVK